MSMKSIISILYMWLNVSNELYIISGKSDHNNPVIVAYYCSLCVAYYCSLCELQFRLEYKMFSFSFGQRNPENAGKASHISRIEFFVHRL
jgi:hypothetical protein